MEQWTEDEEQDTQEDIKLVLAKIVNTANHTQLKPSVKLWVAKETTTPEKLVVW